jgi:isoleucyl-tRNA synthetase
VVPLVADELNVKRVVFAESEASFGRWRAKPNYQVLGPKLGDQVKQVAKSLGQEDGGIAATLAQGEEATVAIDDGLMITLTPGDVHLVQEVPEGWGVASDAGITVALDLELTDELRGEGRARELVRAVQDARKAAGLDVSDRIDLVIQGSGAFSSAAASSAGRGIIAGETLATVVDDIPDADAFQQDVTIDGELVTITLRKAIPPPA